MQNSKIRVVIDTDCLKFLKSNKLGQIIISQCELLIPEIVFQDEYAEKDRTDLKKYGIGTVELDEKDRHRAGDFLRKITHDKDIMNRYLRNQMRPRSIGECECAAIAIKLRCPIVMLDRSKNLLARALPIYGAESYDLKRIAHVIFVDKLNDISKYNQFLALIKLKLNIF